MDTTGFEKIDGWQALELFKNGKKSFCYYGNELHEVIMVGEDLYSAPVSSHARQKTVRTMTVDAFFRRSWYKKKPFDVRQAMRDKPDQWVAAYKNFEGKWFKIGFDSESMNAVVQQMEWDGAPFWQHERARPSLFKECIPIEDVPEEAR